MRKLFKFLFILSYTLFMTNCSNNDSENTSSFDPDGIARLFNAEDADFSKYDNVYMGTGIYVYFTEEEAKQAELSGHDKGIISYLWESIDNTNETMMLHIDNQKLQRKFNTTSPIYYYEYADGNYLYGTFRLKKDNGNFSVIITTFGLYDKEDTLLQSLNRVETHHYLVASGKLAFID